MYVHVYVHEYVSKYYPFYEMDWKAVSGCNATRNCTGSMRLQATVVTPPSFIKYKAQNQDRRKSTRLSVVIPT